MGGENKQAISLAGCADLKLTDHSQSVFIAAPPERVFRFCASREGFEAHFPHAIDRYKGTESWRLGDVFAFRYKFFGLWSRWQGKITHYEENRRFTDLMQVGLFKHFEHTHLFEPAEGGMRYTDSLRFTLGYGSFVDRVIGRRMLAGTFTKRHALLKRALEAG